MKRSITVCATGIAVALVLGANPPAAFATVRVAAPIGDHMMVQRGRPVRLWGTAAPGESVRAALAGGKAATQADASGRWAIALPSVAAGGPFVLAIAGSNSLTFSDGSGRIRGSRVANDRQAGRGRGNDPASGRLLELQDRTQPQADKRRLQHAARVHGHRQFAQSHGALEWDDCAAHAIPGRRSDLVSGRIECLAGGAVPDAVSDDDQGLAAAWRDPALPFVFVQLPNYQEPGAAKPLGTSAWAELREAQAMTLRLPKTAMAVALDIGERGDIHPRNKADVGRRLALQALKLVYRKDAIASGPVLRKMAREGSTIRVSFANVTSALVTADGAPPKGFMLAGADRTWHWADARIDGDSVVVSSPDVPEPVAVRYGWADDPPNTLRNQADLPAAPFRTDDWPARLPDSGP